MIGEVKKSMHYQNLIFEIPYAMDKIYPWFANLELFSEIHPVMLGAKKISAGSGHNSLGIFTVTESATLLGFVPLSPTYNAEILEPEKGKLQHQAQIGRKNYVDIVFSFSETPEHKTVLEEEIRIKSNAFASRLMLRQIEAAHTKLIDNLKMRLSGRMILA
jgi:hypothetical protein